MASNNDWITICDKCYRASCWQGIFMCESSRYAGTLKLRKGQLLEMKLEDSSYMQTDDEVANRTINYK